MRDICRRLQRLEARRQYRMIAATAAAYGLTADELMEEAHRFFGQSLDEQLADIDHIADELRAEGLDVDELKSRLIREYRPI
jgi:hypothetical protein